VALRLPAAACGAGVGRRCRWSIIIFDEYLNYPNWQAHEYRAFQEWCGANGRRYLYSGYTAVNGHVMVTLTQ